MSQQVEDIFKKVTQVEHVLLRPDTYIGSIELNQSEMWIWDLESSTFTKKEIEFSQGLYKIFDEILVNAADNYQRDKNMKELRVSITPTQISVENDGKGIPVQIHKQEGLYVPQLIFGHLLTSSNYDDSIKKVTGGRNGFGAKLTNIFSKKFTLETADKSKLFKMTWTDNMKNHTDPEIGESKKGQYTKIVFRPDFPRFKLHELSEDMVQLLNRRVADMAGILGPHVKVYLNGEKLKFTTFKEYITMYGIEKYVHTVTNSGGRKWDVAIASSDGQLGQVSFVNGINTVRGGTHVNHVIDQIVESLAIHIKKKHKDFKNIKPFQVKAHIMVYVNCLIENPAFDSQTKETLTTKAAQFGSKFDLTDKFVDEILKKTDIMNNIILSARSKLDNKLAKQLTGKKQSRLLGIEKLEDANEAGTRFGDQCTLIVTEGDSAKSLAMAGIEIVGRDRYGVFPLRGKLLNVRDATIKQIMENKEIENLVKILGLQFNKQYENTKTLRYGSLMIMTDQDYDGHHIKGLIINLFDKFWPSLLKQKNFLKQFITPIIKVTKGKNNNISFFSIGDYKKWKESSEDCQLYKIKYYKGLGTSTDQEGQQYFSTLQKHVKPFKYVDQTDQEYIDLVFNKQKADARKEWLLTYTWHNIEDTLDYTQPSVRYKSFITECLALYSVNDNLRSLPSLIDGLKPTQRKILYTLLTHSQNVEYKVSSLSGLVSTYTNYHHGEQSLHSTIIAMAQNFTGSNNINLLNPVGQFGTRSQGGKDSASARYIFTKLTSLAVKLFPESDLHTLNYLEEEGENVEPAYFIPIIPLVLVNGAEGIGTGWMTNIPQYNPREIVLQIQRKIRGLDFEELTPWYKGFTGEISFNANQNAFMQKGRYIQEGDTLFVTEIPVKRTVKEYQSFLQSKMQVTDSNVQPDVVDIKEYHAGNKICFDVKFREGFLQSMNEDNLEKYLKINGQTSINNLVMFDQQGLLKRYNGTVEIMEEFYNVRYKHYSLRRNYILSKMKNELDIVSNKINFLESMLNNTLNIRNLKKKDMVALLKKQKFTEITNVEKIQSTKPKNKKTKEKDEKENVNEEPEDKINDSFKSYDYLLSMPFWSFSEEKIQELKSQEHQLKQRYDQYSRTTPEQIWKEDLDEFLKELDKQEKFEADEQLKRMEKNVDKLFKGGMRLLKDKCLNQQSLQLDNEDSFSIEEEDSDDSLQAKKKKNNKLQKQKSNLTSKVINDLAMLGLTSVRPAPPSIQLGKRKTKQQLQNGDTNDMDIEKGNQMEEENLQESSCKINKKNLKSKGNEPIKQQQSDQKIKNNLEKQSTKQKENHSKGQDKKSKKKIEDDDEESSQFIVDDDSSGEEEQPVKQRPIRQAKNKRIIESEQGSDSFVESSGQDKKLRQQRPKQNNKKKVIDSDDENSSSFVVTPGKSSKQEPKPRQSRQARQKVIDSELSQSGEDQPKSKQKTTLTAKQPLQIKKNQTESLQASKKKNEKNKKMPENDSDSYKFVGGHQSDENKKQIKSRGSRNNKKIIESESEKSEIVIEDEPQNQKENIKSKGTKQVGKKLENLETKKKIKQNEVVEPTIPRQLSTEEQFYEKYGLGQFLKYLTPNDNGKKSTDNKKPTESLTLAERLLQREKEGKIGNFQNSYDVAKNNSNKESIKKTMEIDEEYDILNIDV